MDNWKIGCCGFSLKLETYARKFTAVEVPETFLDPPKRRTLERWQRLVPPGFAFSLQAWQLITHPCTFSGYKRIQREWDRQAKEGFGLFRRGEHVLWAWSIVREAADVLDARAVLFQTPASFTPTRENRENLVWFFSTIDRGGSHLVWDPEGVWEEEEVSAICKDLGLIPAADPLISQGGFTGTFYFRLHPKTRGQEAYTPDDFHRIFWKVKEEERGAQDGFLIWNGPKAARDAESFQTWMAEFRRKGY